GLSAMARVLHSWGATVSGSDQADSEVVSGLRGLGLRIAIGHQAENLGAAGLVVRSRAVPGTNPEIVAAHANGVPVWERTEAMAEIVAARQCVAVSGTHGKTSTTAMLGLMLRAAGWDPSFIVGAPVIELGPGVNGYAGTGEH